MADDQVVLSLIDKQLLQLHSRSEEDLLVFAKHILGYDLINEEEHRDVCNFLMSGRKRITVIACARDTLKTTIGVGSYPLWLLLKNPDLTFLIAGETHDSAKLRLFQIKNKLRNETMFRAVFGDWTPRNHETWNETDATVSVRTDSSVREPTFSTSGIDVVRTGTHYDCIVADDLHSEQNSQTVEQIERVTRYIEVLQPMLKKDGQLIIICTFWSLRDAIMLLLEKLGDDISLFKRGCYREDGSLFYPHRLPSHILQHNKKVMSKALFSSQFLLNPLPDGTAMFHEKDIIFVRDIPQGLRVITLCDPAGDATQKSGEKRDSCMSAIVTVGLHSNGTIYLLDISFDEYTATGLVEEILRHIFQHNPYIVGIEKTGLGNTGSYVRDELRKKGRWGIVLDLMPHGRSKHVRIGWLSPVVDTHRLFVKEHIPHKDELIEEFTRYTVTGGQSKYLDLIDALAYVQDIVQDYGLPAVPEVSDDVADITASLIHLEPNSRAIWSQEQARRSRQSSVMEFLG